MDFEKISCPVCNKNDHRLLFRSKDLRLKTVKECFNVVKCAGCGFIFLNPRPKEYEINSFYPTDFNSNEGGLFYSALRSLFKIGQNSFVRSLKKKKPGAKVLDIGCGNGDFLFNLQNNGFDAFGIEVNVEAKKYIPASLHNRIFFKDLNKCDFPPESFDIITMSQSLEHVFDVNTLLGEAKRIIKKNGLLFICVPDANFFESRLFGPYYYNLEVPRHLYFFTRQSLNALLLKNGLEIKRLLHKSIFELILTPTAFFRSFWNFLEDKNILKNRIIKYFTFIPFIAIRFFLCALFVFNRQNLEVICRLTKGNSTQYA